MKRLHVGLIVLNFALLNAMEQPEIMFGMDKQYLGSLIDTHFKVLPNSCYYLGDLKKVCLKDEVVHYSVYKFLSNLSGRKHQIVNCQLMLRLKCDYQYDQCMDQLLKVVLPQMKIFYCDPFLTKKKKENCKRELLMLSYALLDSKQWTSLAYLLDMGIKPCDFLAILMNRMQNLKNGDLKQYNQALAIGCRFLNSLETLPEYENKKQLKRKLNDEKMR